MLKYHASFRLFFNLSRAHLAVILRKETEGLERIAGGNEFSSDQRLSVIKAPFLLITGTILPLEAHWTLISFQLIIKYKEVKSQRLI